MTAFLRTRRLRGGVRHDFNLRDVKEEVVKMGKNQQKPNYAGEVSSWLKTSMLEPSDSIDEYLLTKINYKLVGTRRKKNLNMARRTRRKLSLLSNMMTDLGLSDDQKILFAISLFVMIMFHKFVLSKKEAGTRKATTKSAKPRRTKKEKTT